MTYETKIIKLDARFAGHRYFTNRIEFKANEFTRFISARNWLWETYGPSMERDLIWCVDDQNEPLPVWAWHLAENPRRFYIFVNPEVLTHFQLKWM